MSYRLEDWDSTPGMGRKFFLFATTARQTLEPTHPSVNSVPADLSSGVKADVT
jgi:hypothetical protein